MWNLYWRTFPIIKFLFFLQKKKIRSIKKIEGALTAHALYYRTKNTAPHRYFDTCFMLSIGGVSDRRWHDCSAHDDMYYIDKEYFA